MDGILAAPETLSLRQALRLAAAVERGYADLVCHALEEILAPHPRSPMGHDPAHPGRIRNHRPRRAQGPKRRPRPPPPHLDRPAPRHPHLAREDPRRLAPQLHRPRRPRRPDRPRLRRDRTPVQPRPLNRHPAPARPEPGERLPVGWRRDGADTRFMPAKRLRPPNGSPTSPKRQPARTGRRSPGAFGSIPGAGALLTAGIEPEKYSLAHPIQKPNPPNPPARRRRRAAPDPPHGRALHAHPGSGAALVGNAPVSFQVMQS